MPKVERLTAEQAS